MPRRIPDYPDAYSGWNGVASYGSYISAFAALWFFYVVFDALTRGESYKDPKGLVKTINI